MGKEERMMKRDTWKLILQVAISVLTAIATCLGVSACGVA